LQEQAGHPFHADDKGHPLCRLQVGKLAFSSTSVDYFGPMTLTMGRRHEKRWGVLFTCLTTRAAHLELSPSLDTDQMLMALMRFINRRGQLENMHSENGTNFVAADRVLKRSLLDLDQKKLSTYKWKAAGRDLFKV
jgi:hypothetical protein